MWDKTLKYKAIEGNWTGREGQKREKENVCLCLMKECTGITPTYTSHTRRVYPITQNAHLNTLYKQPEASKESDAGVTHGA